MNANGSVAKAWLRALELTASIPRHRERVLPRVVDEMAVSRGGQLALLSDRGCLTYGELAERMNQYARWALAQGIKKGEVVCLLMPNQPDYLAIWLGITSVGGVVALLNTNLAGASLLHSIRAVSPAHLIVSAESIDRAVSALAADPAADPRIRLWTHGAEQAPFAAIERARAGYSGRPLECEERPPVGVDDLALYIYTSGTTGLPKAAKVSHARLMQWSHWFAGMMHAGPDDRMYNCLPMYHSVGGVQAPGAMLVSGGSLVLREKFSARQFWSDVVRWDCTIFQYIGELCRYLLLAAGPGTPAQEQHGEAAHRIRLACGNGLAPDVWDVFKTRFRIPQILEFYASTEGGVSLFNVEERPGAIGRIPPYLAHRFAPALVRIDVEQGEPLRDPQGFCIRCEAGEAGEALGRVTDEPAQVGTRFEGYADPAASGRKILRNVFAQDDVWLRTGDLMRRDEKGYFYFVDRLGDTFRWKGENVSSSEVAEVLCAFPGIAHATVYGVAVAGTDGRVGMAAITLTGDSRDFTGIQSAGGLEPLDLAALREHLRDRLPAYARPRFLRVRGVAEVTGTFKYQKTGLVREAYDPAASGDPLYFESEDQQAFVPLTAVIHDRIERGQVRL